MDVLKNVDLRLYSTMRLGGKAKCLAQAHSKDDIAELALWAQNRKLPIITIGEGSNIIWRDEGFPGLVVVNRIIGIEVLEEKPNHTTIKIGAGEVWDKVVEWAVKKHLTGIEFLSLIPGYVGAAPVQNIGAYGAEIKDTFLELEAFDIMNGDFVRLKAADCYFTYRSSRFKKADHGRFLITSITLKLANDNPVPPFYESLQRYLTEHGITKYTPKSIREAVVAIRNSKMPDPKKVANNGSFFTNPIVGKSKFHKLTEQYPDLKAWQHDGGKFKISAGWLVEEAGFKGVHDKKTGMATWKNQALVLVNENARKTKDLLEFKQKITDKVQEMFGISLEQEPELLP